MSVNLGTEAMNAAARLRHDPDFIVVRKGLALFAGRSINMAIGAVPEMRVEATAYARALRDLWVALESAALQVPQTSMPLSLEHLLPPPPLAPAPAEDDDILGMNSLAGGKPVAKKTGR